VASLAWSYDSESHVGSGVATRKAFHNRQVTGDYPNKKVILRSSNLGVGVGITTPSHKTCVGKFLILKTGCEDNFGKD